MSKRRRPGWSLNRTVRELLRRSLGIRAGGPPSNGLEKFAGGWSREELEAFDHVTAMFEQVDEKLWR